MGGAGLDPGSAAQRAALVDGARERAVKAPESQPAGERSSPAGNVADRLAQAIALQWAGAGSDADDVREVLRKFLASALGFGPANRLAQGWAPLVQAFRPHGTQSGAEDEIGVSRAAAFLLSLLPPSSQSLASMLSDIADQAEGGEEEFARDAEPQAPGPVAPATRPASTTRAEESAVAGSKMPTPAPSSAEANGAAETDGQPDQPTPSAAELEQEFEELARLVTEFMGASPQATGQFPPFKRALERALKRLEKKFSGPDAAGVKAILAFYIDLLGRYLVSKAECEVIAKTLGKVFKSTPDIGGKIEASLRDTAVQRMAARGVADYLVHQDSVYYAAFVAQPRRLREEEALRARIGDASLKTLATSRSAGKKSYIRRKGSTTSREDLVVFTGVPPSPDVTLKLAREPFPDEVAFPEFYEIKPVKSLSGSPDQAFAYVHNYAVTRILDVTRAPVWSTTPTLADPRTNTLTLPSLTLVSAAKLVIPGSHADLMKTLRDWVKVSPPFAIIPFMVDGAWGVVPYVAVDVGSAVAAAALAAAITALLTEIEKYAKKIRQAIERIEPVIEVIAGVVVTLVMAVMMFAALIAALELAAAIAGALGGGAATLAPLAAAAALVFVIISGAQAPDAKPEDSPTVFYVGNLVINTSPRIFADVLSQATRLFDDFASRRAAAPIPNR